MTCTKSRGWLRHDLQELLMAPPLRCRDPHIADSTRRLHREQGLEMGFPRQEIMHLQQVESSNAPVSPGLLDLLGSFRPRRGPHLVGRKQGRGHAELGQAVADHRLGGTVHRRRVDQAAAHREECPHHGGTFVAQLGVLPHVERDPAAQPDHGQLLTAGRNRLGERGRLCHRGKGPEDRGDSARGHGFHQGTAAQGHGGNLRSEGSAGFA